MQPGEPVRFENSAPLGYKTAHFVPLIILVHSTFLCLLHKFVATLIPPAVKCTLAHVIQALYQKYMESKMCS